MNNLGISQRKRPWTHGPDTDSQIILDAARKHIESVPYKVSVRWVFYRLYGEGHYKEKDDYGNFSTLCSRARRVYLDDWWHPGTLKDDTRGVIQNLYGYPNSKQAIERIPDDIDLTVNHFFKQDYYVELWYEARAMSSQFLYYTHKIDLVPMGGMSSVSFNWVLAQRIEEAYERYGKKVHILYFGDEDLSGHRIKTNTEEDMHSWCNSPFEFHWCGLTKAQAEKYKVPHSVKNKGYQWEGLSDKAAKEIIRFWLDRYIDEAIIAKMEKEQNIQEQEWRKTIRLLIK